MDSNKLLWNVATVLTTLALLTVVVPQGSARAQDLFHPNASYGVGFDPREEVVGDLNNDGQEK
jgi:hypothetical protein